MPRLGSRVRVSFSAPERSSEMVTFFRLSLTSVGLFSYISVGYAALAWLCCRSGLFLTLPRNSGKSGENRTISAHLQKYVFPDKGLNRSSEMVAFFSDMCAEDPHPTLWVAFPLHTSRFFSRHVFRRSLFYAMSGILRAHMSGLCHSERQRRI